MFTGRKIFTTEKRPIVMLTEEGHSLLESPQPQPEEQGFEQEQSFEQPHPHPQPHILVQQLFVGKRSSALNETALPSAVTKGPVEAERE